jgi:anti-sigma factor RsiW
MISCHQFVSFLLDFIENQLPEDQRLLFQAHLQNCPPCVAYLESYRRTIDLSRRLPDQPVPPELIQRLRSALNSQIQPGAAG